MLKIIHFVDINERYMALVRAARVALLVLLRHVQISACSKPQRTH